MAGIGHLVRDHLWLLVAVLVYGSQIVPVISQTGPLPTTDELTDEPGTDIPTNTDTTSTTSTTTTTPTTIDYTSQEPENDDADKVEALTVGVIILGVIAAIAIGIIIAGAVWYWRQKRRAGGDAPDTELGPRTIPVKANDQSTLQKVRKYLRRKKKKEAVNVETSPSTSAPDHPTVTATVSADDTYDPVNVEEITLQQPYNNVSKAEKGESIYQNHQQGATEETGGIYSDADQKPGPVNLSATSGQPSSTQALGQGGPAKQEVGYVNATAQEEGQGDYSSLEDGTKYESHHYTGLKDYKKKKAE